MRRFLTYTALFLLPVVIVLALAEAYMRHLPNAYRYKAEWMNVNAERVSVLILGNSHGFFDLRPSVMGDSVFNLCNVSQRAEQDYCLLMRYADECKHLRTVFLVADNSNLFDVPLEEEEPYRATYYQLYMDIGSHSCLSRYGFELSHISACREKVLSVWRRDHHTMGCDSLGWGTDYRLSDREPDVMSPKRVKMHQCKDWTEAQRNAGYVKQIACWCKENGVQLVLLQTPVVPAYSKRVPQDQLSFVSRLHENCRHDYGALLADFSNDDRFVDIDFFDSDHLSDVGADKFSALLVEWYRNQMKEQ